MVTDTTTTALIGVGGLVVGAVGSGGVQAYLSRADRRRDGHHAARVLYVQLHDGEAAVATLRDLRNWEAMITDWDAYGAAWSEYRDRLTHVLNTERFATVNSAFQCMASLARGRNSDLEDAATSRDTIGVPSAPADALGLSRNRAAGPADRAGSLISLVGRTRASKALTRSRGDAG